MALRDAALPGLQPAGDDRRFHLNTQEQFRETNERIEDLVSPIGKLIRAKNF